MPSFRPSRIVTLRGYTIGGMKVLAILFFLINILKKYYEGGATRQGLTWGLTPTDLIKNFAVVLVVIFSTEVLGAFDAILVAVEGQYRSTAPILLPSGNARYRGGRRFGSYWMRPQKQWDYYMNF